MPNETGGQGSGDSQGAGNQNNDSQTFTVDVDGEQKTLTADDIKSLVSQQASLTQQSQNLAEVTKACEKYGIDPATLVNQAEGAFNVLSDLMEMGIVDQQGNINQEKLMQQKPDDRQKGQDFNLPGDRGTEFSEDKVTSVIEKALKPFQDKMDALEKDQQYLTRLRISDSIKGKFDNLEDEDVAKLLTVAGKDRSKTLMQHAEDLSKAKESKMGQLRERFAKEFGVNLEEFDANKLNEQDAKGGASTFVKDRKISFNPKDKDAVSPRRLMQEYLDKQSGG